MTQMTSVMTQMTTVMTGHINGQSDCNHFDDRNDPTYICNDPVMTPVPVMTLLTTVMTLVTTVVTLMTTVTTGHH